MTNKIEDYICSECELELKVLSLISYSCPNCGSILLPKDTKYQEQLDMEINGIKDKEHTIKTAITKIPKLEALLKKNKLEGIVDIIQDMIGLIKNPSTDIRIKVIVASVIIYLISPTDMVPDLIPVVGYLDDIAIVLLAANLIASLDNNYGNIKMKQKQKTSISSLIYIVTNNAVNANYNYTEEKNKRIWILNVNDVKKYNLKMLDNSLIKAPEKYINLPYLDKTIVPISEVDRILFDHNLEEQRNIARMLGAKTIKFSVQDIESKSKEGKMEIKIPFKGEGEHKITVENDLDIVKTYFDEYQKFDSINIKYIDNFFWYFTLDTPFKSIFKERLFSNLKRKEFEYILKTDSNFSTEVRANLVMKNKLNEKIEISSSKTSKIKMEIEFFDLPDDISNNKEKIYAQIEIELAKRQKEIDFS